MFALRERDLQLEVALFLRCPGPGSVPIAGHADVVRDVDGASKSVAGTSSGRFPAYQPPTEADRAGQNRRRRCTCRQSVQLPGVTRLLRRCRCTPTAPYPSTLTGHGQCVSRETLLGTWGRRRVPDVLRVFGLRRRGVSSGRRMRTCWQRRGTQVEPNSVVGLLPTTIGNAPLQKLLAMPTWACDSRAGYGRAPLNPVTRIQYLVPPLAWKLPQESNAAGLQGAAPQSSQPNPIGTSTPVGGQPSCTESTVSKPEPHVSMATIESHGAS